MTPAPSRTLSALSLIKAVPGNVLVGLGVPDIVGEADGVMVIVPVGVTVGLCDGVGVGVCVGVAVGVFVGVGVGVPVKTITNVGVGVFVWVGTGVGVEVGGEQALLQLDTE